MLELTIRLVASLAVVVGLLLLLARLVGRRLAGRDGALVQVLHRQPLSRGASVSVLSVGSRVLVVGTTDQQVQLLAELDPDEVENGEADEPLDLGVAQLLPGSSASVRPLARTTDPEPVRRAGAHRATSTRRPAEGALAGSVLSASTWRQALAAVTGKAS